jgi:hypothetical protein
MLARSISTAPVGGATSMTEVRGSRGTGEAVSGSCAAPDAADAMQRSAAAATIRGVLVMTYSMGPGSHAGKIRPSGRLILNLKKHFAGAVGQFYPDVSAIIVARIRAAVLSSG